MMRKANLAEQAALREVWPDGLPPGSLNERIEREWKAEHDASHLDAPRSECFWCEGATGES
jgi:hypothetical protein